MPWSTRKPTAIEIAPDWLKPYCEQFLHNLIDQGYAPATMRTPEKAEELKKIVSQLGVKGPQDMGKVMGTATKALAGKADGKMISEIVKKLLTA